MWPGDRIELPTRGFQFSCRTGLCDSIGIYVYPFKRLTPVFGGPFYRFEHIVSYSSGKVMAKLNLVLAGTVRILTASGLEHGRDP